MPNLPHGINSKLTSDSDSQIDTLTASELIALPCQSNDATKPVENYVDKPKYIKWDDYPPGRKHRAFDLLGRIGAKLIIVYQSMGHKVGLTLAVKSYNERRRVTIRINYITAHICEIELVGVN